MTCPRPYPLTAFEKASTLNHYFEPVLWTSTLNQYSEPVLWTSTLNQYFDPVLQTSTMNWYSEPVHLSLHHKASAKSCCQIRCCHSCHCRQWGDKIKFGITVISKIWLHTKLHVSQLQWKACLKSMRTYAMPTNESCQSQKYVHCQSTRNCLQVPIRFDLRIPAQQKPTVHNRYFFNNVTFNTQTDSSEQQWNWTRQKINIPKHITAEIRSKTHSFNFTCLYI